MTSSESASIPVKVTRILLLITVISVLVSTTTVLVRLNDGWGSMEPGHSQNLDCLYVLTAASAFALLWNGWALAFVRSAIGAVVDFGLALAFAIPAGLLYEPFVERYVDWKEVLDGTGKLGDKVEEHLLPGVVAVILSIVAALLCMVVIGLSLLRVGRSRYI